MHTYRTFSSAETRKLGGRAAGAVLRRRGGRAVVLALRGELGSGKTTFVQGFLRGLGVRARSASPTFILARRIPLRRGPFRNFVHVDAYRLRRGGELRAGTFRELIGDRGTVALVEWADRIRRTIPKRASWLAFHHGRRPHERTIRTALRMK